MPIGFARLTHARLKVWLTVLFFGLAVPSAVLVVQAYRQSEFETFYRYQQEAAALAERIDANWRTAVTDLERRGIAEYSFFVDTGSDVPVRSPLAALPSATDLPGLVGYFRLYPDGRFESPVLPGSTAGRERAALSPEDYRRRKSIHDEIRSALQSGSFDVGGESVSRLQVPANDPVPGRAASDRSAATRTEASEDAEMTALEAIIIDRQRETTAELDEVAPAPAIATSLGNLNDLDLDDSLQKRSVARQATIDRERRRVDQSPEAPSGFLEEAEALPQASPAEIRIDAFASAPEPLRFGALGSGKAALVRDVWIDGDRHIQGAVFDMDRLFDGDIADAFRRSSLSDMSNLVIAIGEDIVSIVNSKSADVSPSRRYDPTASALNGNLLYQTRLSAPFNAVTLLFSVTELPTGPETSLLGWTTLALGLMLSVGVIGLYRVGTTQIRLAQQQQDFVAAISHELKTPLTSIRMYGEILQSGWVDDERRMRYYAYIHEESERLSRLIDNVLQLARISRRGASFDLQPIAISELVDLARSKLEDPARRAGFELVVEADTEVAGERVMIDADCFLQIVINLVDNAMKFSNESELKKVHCRFARQSSAVLAMSVRDYGPGVPRSHLKRIFELFYRPNSELTRETVGTGIGLAIVSTLARGMGGDVNVTNREPGAEFTVTFPIAADGAQPEIGGQT